MLKKNSAIKGEVPSTSLDYNFAISIDQTIMSENLLKTRNAVGAWAACESFQSFSNF